VRGDQRAFLAARIKTCGGKTGVDAVACLTKLYNARFDVLTAPPK
jgi:hypothetical protein